tara:strand:+ start:145 stop:318 length:174 start_codon:yes stop_codon:yes gene_type:complete
MNSTQYNILTALIDLGLKSAGINAYTQSEGQLPGALQSWLNLKEQIKDEEEAAQDDD